MNQDGSVNSAANAAARGSVISIYATGGGQSTGAGQSVTVQIGGSAAAVQYAGQAPGEVAGVLQVNAVVPQAIAPGAAVPVTIGVGGAASQAGVTVAVK